MANQEHLEILGKGTEAWNERRFKHPGVRPDLSTASLAKAHLAGANLGGADLTDADLREAFLRDADLTDADLTGAFFIYATLLNADLANANLSDADLGNAELIGANLSSTNLALANIRHANLLTTTFADCDLRQVEGLDSAIHHGPSTIGTNTLERSHGQIPDTFLKGCGFSDWQIENAKLFDPDLSEAEITTTLYEISRLRGEQPINLKRVFISYTRDDNPFVEAIEQRFDEKGVRYWRDVHDMKAGRMDLQIDRAIDMNPLVLLVLSEASVGSDWVEWEAKRARKLERDFRDKGTPRSVLCPVALDDAWKNCDWPGKLRDQIEKYNVLDFSRWKDDEHLAEAFGKLYDGLVLNY